MNQLRSLPAKFKGAILPCLLSFGLITAEGVERDFSSQSILSQFEETADLDDLPMENMLRRTSSGSSRRSGRNNRQRNHKVVIAYGSFFNENTQTISPTIPPGTDFKIAFPNSTVAPNNIRADQGGTLFTILKTGVYEISYSFTLGSGSVGAGPIALDIDQSEVAVNGTQVFIDDVVNDNFSRTVQLFLRAGQTIDVNYFDPQSTDRVIITQANITFNLISSSQCKR